MKCQCHSGKKYDECCKRYHEGELPDTALTLMRSRYCAYALNLAEYIIDTTHPDNPQYIQDHQQWKESIKEFCNTTDFLGLEIIDTSPGEPFSFVTFKAILAQSGQDTGFTERSHFQKKEGRWLYRNGEFKSEL